MASRRITYEVGFTGDTSQLQSALKTAVADLQKITSMGGQSVLSDEIVRAAQAARELEIYLQRAYNTDTGKLDLTKFQSQLKASGTTIEQYANTLRAIGPAGQEAFMSVATAISKAEVPIKRASSLMSNLWMTMKNTMRWQLTSSALHGFIGTVQTAYRYAQDLNESLNSIRIVTGNSANDMAAFAKQANEAARALNTTTTTYTDASLIYFQQGLSDQEVADRTAVTIKMANVAGQSAETISQQMTAIWNNFDDGTRSLESYGDAMVKLGAETASSSAEIAEGIEKFAPIASTVGLSFDYAAAALATVTATTRESASVAGTALRTLFSRIEGLKLGETLDDGTDLNKYSQALATVGINIKDTSGELKSMDTILDELGEKWQTLGRDQQMALAETVAGVRQYTQLVAILDNWDFMQENIERARESSGELGRQAEIFADSWEAARKQVKDAAEDIYDSLINEEFFIDFDQWLANVFHGMANVIDGMGGMKGVILTLGTLFLDVYQDKIASSLENAIYNLSVFTDKARQSQLELQNQSSALASAMARDEFNPRMNEMQIQAEDVQLQNLINGLARQLTDEQMKQLEGQKESITLIKQMELGYEASALALEQNGINLERVLADLEGLADGKQLNSKTSFNLKNQLNDALKGLNIAEYEKADVKTFGALAATFEGLSARAGQLGTLRTQVAGLGDDLKNSAEQVEQVKTSFKALTGLDLTGSSPEEWLKQIEEALGKVRNAAKIAGDGIRINFTDQATPEQIQAIEAAIKRLGDGYVQLGANTQAAAGAAAIGADETTRFTAAVEGALNQTLSWSEIVVAVGSSLTKLVMAVQSIQRLGSIWNNDDLTTGQKIIQTITTLGMIIPSLMNVYKVATATKAKYMVVTMAGTKAENAQAVADLNAAGKKVILTTAVEGNTVAVVANNAAWLASPIGWILAAITAVVAAFAIYTDHLKKNAEAIREANEKTVEAARASQEGVEANKDLVDSYKELLATYEDTGDGKDDLAEKAREVADAYGIEGAAIASLTGDYKKLDAAIANAQKQELERSYAELNSAVQAAGENAVNSISSPLGIWVSSNEKLQAEALEILRKSFPDGDFYEGGLFSISLDNASLEDLHAIQAYYEDIVETAKYSTDTEVKKWAEFFKDDLNTLNEVLAEYDDIYKDRALTAGKLGMFSDVDPNEDFPKWLEEVTARLKELHIEGTDAEKIIREIVGYRGLEDVYTLSQVKGDVTSRLGLTSERKQQIENEFDRARPEDARILANLPWENYNGENFDILYNQTKAWLDLLDKGTKISTDYASAQELVDAVNSKSGIKEENLNKYRELFSSEEEYIVFLKASEDEQIRIANNLVSQRKKAAESNRDALERNLNDQRDYYNDLKEASKADWIQSNKRTGGYWDFVDWNDQFDLAVARYQERTHEAEKAFTFASQLATGMFDEEKGGFNQDLIDKVELGETLKDSIIKAFHDGGEEEARAAIISWLQTVTGGEDGLANYLAASDQVSALEEKLEDLKPDAILDAYTQSIVNATAKGAKSLGELNKMLGQHNVNSKAYRVGIVELAKAIPGLYDEIEAYTQALDENGNETEESIDLYNKLLSEFHSVVWSQAATDIRATTVEIDKFNAQLKAGQTIDVSKYNKSFTEVRSSLEEAFGGEFTEAWIQENYDLVQQLASDDIEVASRAAQTFALIASAMDQGLDEQFTSFISRTDLFKVAIDELNNSEVYVTGDGDMSGLIDALLAAGATADEVIAILQSVAGTDIGFEVEGLDGLENFDSLSEIDKIRTLRSLENVRIKSTGGPDVTSKAPSGGGGGGGSSVSASKKLERKEPVDTEDRYHVIDRRIEAQTRSLAELDKQAERTYGLSRLELYNEKLKETQDQLDNYNTRLAEAQDYLIGDRARLNEVFGSDYNLNIDASTGELLNYEEVLAQTVDEYNAFVDSYEAWRENFNAQNENLGKISDEQKKALEKEKEEWELRAEEAEKTFERQQKALKIYEDTEDEIAKLNDLIRDNLRTQQDIQLNNISFKLSVVLELKDLKQQVRDFSKEIEESFGDLITHGLATSILDRESAQAELDVYKDYVEAYQGYRALLDEGSPYLNTEEVKEGFKDLVNNIVNSGESLLDWLDTVENMFVDALEDASERYSAFVNILEHNSTVLNSIKELYALQGVTYKTNAGFATLQSLGLQRLDTAVAQARTQRLWYEETANLLAQAEADLKSLNGDETDPRYDTYKKNYDALLEESQQAQQAMLQAGQQALEEAQANYQLIIEKSVYDFGQTLSNGLGLDLLQDKYDHYIETEERYLDKVNEAYQVSAWYMKLQNDIDSATNPVARKRLENLQKEIDIRREGNKLSQYDLDILEAKYKVAQAQMALDDAENNKTKLRLTRDANGNWNYQYSADPNDVAEKQQELLQAEIDWYNIAKQQVEDTTGEIIAAWQACENEVASIYNDMTLTDEERAKRAEEIYSFYTKKVADLEEQKQEAIKDMTEAGNKNLLDNAILTGDSIVELTGIQSETLQKVIQDSNASIQTLLLADSETLKDIVGDNQDLINAFENTYSEDLASMTENTEIFEERLNELLGDANVAWEGYQATVQRVSEECGITLDDLQQDIDKVKLSTDEAKEAAELAAIALDESLTAIKNAQDGYLGLAKAVYEAVGAMRDLAGAATESLNATEALEAFNKSQQQLAEMNQANSGLNDYYEALALYVDQYGGSIEEALASKTAQTLLNERQEKLDRDSGAHEWASNEEILEAIRNQQPSYNVIITQGLNANSEAQIKKWLEDHDLPGFASGGYTGEFNDAKLAWLHEKELVLNEQDTKNILEAVQITRALAEIEKVLNGSGLMSLMALSQQYSRPISVDPTNMNLEQQVHVTAEFPNVTSAREIEEALENITNDAAQWARRRKS